jgi:hypothetical protein
MMPWLSIELGWASGPMKTPINLITFLGRGLNCWLLSIAVGSAILRVRSSCEDVTLDPEVKFSISIGRLGLKCEVIIGPGRISSEFPIGLFWRCCGGRTVCEAGAGLRNALPSSCEVGDIKMDGCTCNAFLLDFHALGLLGLGLPSSCNGEVEGAISLNVGGSTVQRYSSKGLIGRSSIAWQLMSHNNTAITCFTLDFIFFIRLG